MRLAWLRKMAKLADLAMMANHLARQGGPMLNILTSQNLSNILIIVTRYFGGILLGTGGLVKAYTEVSLEALNKANIVQKELGQEAKIVVNYADLEKLKYYLKQNKIYISSTEYAENVNVMIEITQEKLDKILEQKQNLNFHILQCEILKPKFITTM